MKHNIIKNILAIMIGILFFIGFQNQTKAAEDIFQDVPVGSSHYQGIMDLVHKGVINGYTSENGTKLYKPSDKISRSQTATLFTKALNLSTPSNVDEVLKNFVDINSSHYHAKSIASTYEAGIFKGSNGYFNDGNLSREQMATVIARAFKLKDTGENTGIRLDNVSSSHREGVKLLAQHKITNQLADFRPKETVSRGQFATFLYRAMQLTTESPTDESSTPNNDTGTNPTPTESTPIPEPAPTIPSKIQVAKIQTSEFKWAESDVIPAIIEEAKNNSITISYSEVQQTFQQLRDQGVGTLLTIKGIDFYFSPKVWAEYDRHFAIIIYKVQ